MDTTFGEQTLAHRVHGHCAVQLPDALNELIDNSIDAKCTRVEIALAFTESNVVFATFDDGVGMEPGSDLSANNSHMKTSGNIGKYYKGVFTTLFSMKAKTVYTYSKQEGKPLYMMKYKVTQMLDDARTKLNNGTFKPKELTDKWLQGPGNNKCVLGPYQYGEDNDDPISRIHFEDSIIPCLKDSESALIKSFVDGKLHQGTSNVFVWPKKTLPPISDAIIRKCLDGLMHKRKIREDIRIVYKHKAICYEPFHDPVSGLFGDNKTHDVRCVASPRLRTCFALFKGQIYPLVSSALSFDELKTADDRTEFTVRMTLVGRKTHETQMRNLGVSDFKLLNLPVIETPWGFLGVGGEYKIPSEYTGRQQLGFLEPVHIRTSIYIDEKNEQNAFPLFGVNGKKDRPDNSQPSEIADSVYRLIVTWARMQQCKIGVLFKPGVSGSAYNDPTGDEEARPLPMYPAETIGEEGFTESTRKWCHEADVAWALDQVATVRERSLKIPKIGQQLRRTWEVDFMTEQHNKALASKAACGEEQATNPADLAPATSQGARVQQVRKHIRKVNQFPKESELARIRSSFKERAAQIETLCGIIEKNESNPSFRPHTVGQYQLCLSTITSTLGKLLEDPKMKEYADQL